MRSPKDHLPRYIFMVCLGFSIKRYTICPRFVHEIIFISRDTFIYLSIVVKVKITYVKVIKKLRIAKSISLFLYIEILSV